MKKTLAILLGLMLTLPALVGAEPAPWYQWRSKATGALACSQTPLGQGWERLDGAYRNPRCEKRRAAK